MSGKQCFVRTQQRRSHPTLHCCQMVLVLSTSKYDVDRKSRRHAWAVDLVGLSGRTMRVVVEIHGMDRMQPVRDQMLEGHHCTVEVSLRESPCTLCMSWSHKVGCGW